MVYFLFSLFFLLIAAFLKMFDTKIINRGLPKFPIYEPGHRHPTNERRRRGDSVEIETTMGIPILVTNKVEPGSFYLLDPINKTKVVISPEDFI